MQDKHLLLGIDEFTFTILLKNRIPIDMWIPSAEKIVSEFVRCSLIERVFDRRLEETDIAKLQGYSRIYNLGLTDYYFAVAYNPDHPTMGVCVRFSARAWAVYQARYRRLFDQEIILPDFLHMIADNSSELVRLTRVDMTADYFNYDLNLTDLYSRLKDNSVTVVNDLDRNTIKNISFHGKNQQIETIYIGSRKTNSRGFLRVYDKRIEQLSTNGFRIKEALSCKNWIRFEAVYKGVYAHAISEELLKHQLTDKEFIQYIAQLITQKYRFYDSEKESYTAYTCDLIEVSNGNEYARLRSESPRDNSLAQNIAHIQHGSGFFPTLYKIEHLYGNTAVKKFIEHLLSIYRSNYWLNEKMRKELCLWLKKHRNLKEMSLEDSL